MTDKKKIVKGLQDAEISLRGFANHFPPLREECHKQADACHDVLELLKEQEAQKFFVDESGKITPLPAVVRCKDCKHGEKANDVYLCGKQRGFGLAHEPNWFCADGERR